MDVCLFYYKRKQTSRQYRQFFINFLVFGPPAIYNLEANLRTYGYAYCGRPVSELRRKPQVRRFPQTRCKSSARAQTYS